MKLNLRHIVFLLWGISFPFFAYAQVDFNKTPDDDLGNNEDEFQETFFEALKQKGIENYSKSIESLDKCLTLDDTKPIVYFELGKNYNKLKKYSQAEKALTKAVEGMPDNVWVLDELYDVYMKQENHKKAVETIKQLVNYHPDYKQDLASVLVLMKRYDEALKILDELDKEQGISKDRDKIRNTIYSLTGRKKDQIKNLENRVSNNLKNEESYLELIYRYSANNEKEKAFEAAKKLLEINPESELVHLALYKFYINDDKPDKAIESMKRVVKSNTVNPNAKIKVLKDFVKFAAENPQYESDLIEATSMVTKSEDNVSALIQMAEFHLAKEDKKQALKFYEKALAKEDKNFGVLRNVLLLYIDFNEFDKTIQKASIALEIYPSQPILYLVNAVALNKKSNYVKAIESLESGLDYIIDDPKMEADFYMQLNIAHTGLNNLSKAKTFKDKALKLAPSN